MTVSWLSGLKEQYANGHWSSFRAGIADRERMNLCHICQLRVGLPILILSETWHEGKWTVIAVARRTRKYSIAELMGVCTSEQGLSDTMFNIILQAKRVGKGEDMDLTQSTW